MFIESAQFTDPEDAGPRGHERIMKDASKRLPVADRIRKGLEEAIRHAKGEITLRTTTLELPDPPPEVKAEDVIRIRLDNQMSQAVFARVLNVSPKTVQSWEQGSRKSSLRLIQVIRKNPALVFQALGMLVPESHAPTRKRSASKAE